METQVSEARQKITEEGQEIENRKLKNWEKYESEIREFKTTAFGLLESGILRLCAYISCGNCDFQGDCDLNRLEWLYSDYKDLKPKLTKQERAVVEAFSAPTHNYRIARDANGVLYIYYGIPARREYNWSAFSPALEIEPELFPFITWESRRAWSIKDLLDLEVEK